MGATVVGVDIGSAAVRAVEVSGYDSAKPVVVRQHEVPLPAGAVLRGEVIESATVTTAIKRLWATGGFTSKDVVLGIGGPRVFARETSVPRAPLAQIRESLPFLVQDQLPVPVADALLDFYPVADAPPLDGVPQVSGLLVAALKEAVTANVASVLAAGLKPVHVDLIPFAQLRALTPRRSTRSRDMVVSVGAYSTNVVVAVDGVPLFVRIIPNGGDDLTRSISQRLQLAPDAAEQTKRTIGMGGPHAQLEDRLAIELAYESVGELLGSIRTTLTYYANAKPMEPVERIVLSGGGAQLSGFAAAMAEQLRLPVVAGDAFSALTTTKKVEALPLDQQDAFTTALGLALGSHA